MLKFKQYSRNRQACKEKGLILIVHHKIKRPPTKEKLQTINSELLKSEYSQRPF
jgi:IS5 family transposase